MLKNNFDRCLFDFEILYLISALGKPSNLAQFEAFFFPESMLFQLSINSVVEQWHSPKQISSE